MKQRSLASLLSCIRNCDRAVIILNGKGCVQLMTRRARQILGEFYGNPRHRSKRLPEALERWIGHKQSLMARDKEAPSLGQWTVADRNGEQLVLHVVADKKDGELYLLRLEKQLPALSLQALNALGLSERETEVLFWVAHGRTNREIGAILSLSPLTVRTHLEHIFRKLGVETRTGAAARAYEIASTRAGSELEK